MNLKVSIFVVAIAVLSPPAAFFSSGTSNVTTATPGEALPELPREYVDTTSVKPTGKLIHVPAGGDFQAALEAAQPGDVITLAAGATYHGPFTAPLKPGTQWITVRTATPDDALGALNQRISPAQAHLMPRLTSGAGAVLTLAAGAHHYRFIGLEMSPTPGTFLYHLVGPAVDPRNDADQPHHVIFDRCYLHGDPAKGSRRGIALNGRHMAVIHSHLSHFKEAGADSQALAGWNGAGPFKILDNFLEGAAENVMFGGADPLIPGLVPSDIEIRGNTFSKDVAWNPRGDGATGPRWTVKNLFELKNARRVLVEGNEFRDYSWGPAFVLTPRNQSGSAPWSTVEDVTIRYNWIHGVWYLATILGDDDIQRSRPSSRILLEHNLAYDLSDPSLGGYPKIFTVIQTPDHLVIRHNTVLSSPKADSSFLFFVNARPKKSAGFVFRDNIIQVGTYGLGAEHPGLGNTSTTLLDGHASSWLFERNLFIGVRPAARALYPRGQFWEDTLDKVGFVDVASKDFRLSDKSRYRVGADVASLFATLDHYMTGTRPLTGR